MTNKKFWLGMLVVVLAFGMTVVGCENGVNVKSKIKSNKSEKQSVFISPSGNVSVGSVLSAHYVGDIEILEYDWRMDGREISIYRGGSNMIIPIEPGNYYVRVWLRDNGDISPVSETVTVSGNEILNLSVQQPLSDMRFNGNFSISDAVFLLNATYIFDTTSKVDVVSDGSVIESREIKLTNNNGKNYYWQREWRNESTSDYYTMGENNYWICLGEYSFDENENINIKGFTFYGHNEEYNFSLLSTSYQRFLGNITISPSIIKLGQELTALYDGSENFNYQWEWLSLYGNFGLPIFDIIEGANQQTFTPIQYGTYRVSIKSEGFINKESEIATVVFDLPNLEGYVYISPNWDVAPTNS